MKVEFTRDGEHLVIDPETESFFRAFDLQETHAGYHTICRSVYGADKGEPPIVNSALGEDGVDTWRDCIDPAVAEDISRRIDHAIVTTTPPNTTVPLDSSFRQDLSALLNGVFSPTRTAIIEAYLGCHFRVVQCQLYRTETSVFPHISFRWHRDMEPMAQLHIMLYLTPSGPDDPTTEFLTLAGTRRMASYGYAFPQFSERIMDLRDAIPDRQPLPKIWRPKLKAGDATVFGAPRILHRGLDGAGGTRDVMLINLLPSLVSWEADIPRFGCDHLFWEFGESNTLQTNPFALTLEPDKRFSGKPVNEWVINADLLPEVFG